MGAVLPIRVWALIAGLSLLCASLLVAALSVRHLEQHELSYEREPKPLSALQKQADATSISARLASVELTREELATFEVCAEGDLTDPRFQGAFELVVWRPRSKKLELKIAMDAAHRAFVKRARGHSCLPVGSGRVAETGTYALDIVWAGRTPSAELLALPLRARVLAKRPLGLPEGSLVLCAALGAMLCALAGFGQRAVDAPEVGQKSPIWAVGFALLGMVLFALALELPLPGALGGLARGLSIAVVEVALAVVGGVLVFRHARHGLSLFAPARAPGAWLLVACGCALALHPLSTLAMKLIPSTGEAPIEAFISWPSGALTFAMLGMIVPLAEELFFRGLLFGTLLPAGRLVAALGTIVLFTAAHAQQAWGNWGVLMSLTMTSVVLTMLRAFSGSTLVPAVAHVLFNLSLWRDSFAG